MSSLTKTSYFILLLCVALVSGLLYVLFIKKEKPEGDPHQITLTIKPFTQREQQDLLKAQAQEERTVITGPLITLMSASEAEKKVLNLHEPPLPVILNATPQLKQKKNNNPEGF